MSWYSDGVSSWYRTMLDAGRFVMKNNPMGANHSNYVDEFFDSEKEKANLRGTEITSFLSGFPIVGDFIKGIEGIAQLEDLYSNTGKTAEYPSISSAGASGLGKGLDRLSGKIEDGTHDLFEHYSGTIDDTQKVNNQRMWSYMSQNWNKRHNNYYLR